MRLLVVTIFVVATLFASPCWAQPHPSSSSQESFQESPEAGDGTRRLAEFGFGTLGLLGGMAIGGIVAASTDGPLQALPYLTVPAGAIGGTYLGGTNWGGNGSVLGTSVGFGLGTLVGVVSGWVVFLIGSSSGNAEASAIAGGLVFLGSSIGGATIGYELTHEPVEPDQTEVDLFAAPSAEMDGGTVGVRMSF